MEEAKKVLVRERQKRLLEPFQALLSHSSCVLALSFP
jgi:hypothetical protein